MQNVLWLSIYFCMIHRNILITNIRYLDKLPISSDLDGNLNFYKKFNFLCTFEIPVHLKYLFVLFD